MIYSVDFTKCSAKDLEKISQPYYENIKQAVLSLAKNPRPPGCKKLKGKDSYRIRVGMYRIIYEIMENKLIITVIAIGHRKEIYK